MSKSHRHGVTKILAAGSHPHTGDRGLGDSKQISLFALTRFAVIGIKARRAFDERACEDCFFAKLKIWVDSKPTTKY